jgi:type 1 glutamine amidotransferase
MNAPASRREFLYTTLGLAAAGPLAAPGPLAAAWPAGGAATEAEQKPLRVCLVSGSLEYKSDESLAKYQEYLEANFPVRCSRAFRRADDDLPGLENLETCDVLLLFTRRLTISGEQLDRVKKYCAAGRPMVGIRTASHAFQNWLQLDREVLGGNYHGHYPEGPATKITIVDSAKDHPILAGFEPFESAGSLYRNDPLAQDTTLLLRGQIPRHVEPIAWTRMHGGGRVFYTSLGHPLDFEVASFQRMLAQALLWAGGRI